MKIRSLEKTKKLKIAVCMVLVLSLILSSFSLGNRLEVREVESLADSGEPLQITLLKAGNNTSQETTRGEDGNQDAGASKPDDTIVENSEHKKQEQTEIEKEEQNLQEDENQNSEPDDSKTDGNEESQDDGIFGEEGDEEAEIDLAMVMTWYKYGKVPKTIVCGPSQEVGKKLNVAQLSGKQLKYEFSLTGTYADNVHITNVSLQEGDTEAVHVAEKGKVKINLPNQSAQKDYTFYIEAQIKGKNADGKTVKENVLFTYVLHCYYAEDLELDLNWEKKDGSTGTMTCTANESVTRTIESHRIEGGIFSYVPKLTGSMAKHAKLTKGYYTTSTGKTGELQTKEGELRMKPATNADEQYYYLTFEAELKDEDGDLQTITYSFHIKYIDTLDLKLSFKWLEKGITPRELVCQPNRQVSTNIKNNQLSGGAIPYEIKLTGKDSQDARILNISYESGAAGGGKLKETGSLPMTIPEGALSNDYKISVLTLVDGRQMTFEIVLRYVADVRLQMSYLVNENGKNVKRVVTCENSKTKTADVIYDDQLENGNLSYSMELLGMDASSLSITSVECYQNGSGKINRLFAKDTVELLLKEKRTGENTFTVTAKDQDGLKYTFKINIPYKHRGENTVNIVTNMRNGQVVTNEVKTNLNVRAWSEDEDGNVVSYIPANGTDTKLIVSLDGEVLTYVSSSGNASEYILYPKNPQTGDTNTHILHIYAEDAEGNYGEMEILLKGQRNQAGQKKGKATIRIDLTNLGLGVVETVNYDVLADEPISYAVAKAVLGMDTGEPFGKAEEALGWKGSYLGTLDTGFYLQRLITGHEAVALDGEPWAQYGANDEEILNAIDKKFGKGTGLATLWRCIYRNGLNKSSGSGKGSFGEFDYTSGSGWVFALNGTYYPGLSMSEYYLEDGDVLTLRFTLAYGWDLGGGTPGYGNTVGYCVTAVDGVFNIEHKMEKVEHKDGSISYVCRFCRLDEGCAHEHKTMHDLGNGTHTEFCEDCRQNVGTAQEHSWEHEEAVHRCNQCGAEESHLWTDVEGSNTATCLEGGTKKMRCVECAFEKTVETAATGHALNNRWNHTETEHYQQCSACESIIESTRDEHHYVYDENDDDWYCKECDAGHDWDYCGNDNLVIDDATCQQIKAHCSKCMMQFIREGFFEAYHDFHDGVCDDCGTKDPTAEAAVNEAIEESKDEQKNR